MQTFLPYSDFKKTVECLDYRRLGKMRVEAMQIIKAIKQGPRVIRSWDPKILPNGRKYVHIYGYFPEKLSKYEKYVKTPWYYHPATRMWLGHEDALALYHNSCIEEWINRGYNNNMKLIDHEKDVEFPHWIGNERFHSCHRQTLLYKNFEWYSQFDWKEKPKYEYWWPDEKKNI